MAGLWHKSLEGVTYDHSGYPASRARNPQGVPPRTFVSGSRVAYRTRLTVWITPSGSSPDRWRS